MHESCSADLISANIAEVKVHGPDYEGMNKEEAVQDFLKRINHYEDCYVPLGDDDSEKRLSYMKVINAGERLVINRSAGNLQSRIGYWEAILLLFLLTLGPSLQTLK